MKQHLHFTKTFKYSFILLLAVFGYNFSFGQLVAWETTGLVGTEVTFTATTVAANIATGGTSRILSRGTGISPSANADRFGATGFSTTTIDLNDYFQFGVTPSAGFQMSLTSITFNFQRSGTGPTALALRSSADGYASNLTTFSPGASTSVLPFSFTLSGFTNLTTETTFRIYGFTASAGGGTAGIESAAGNDLVINGTVTPIGPPTPNVSFASATSSLIEGNSGTTNQTIGVTMNSAPTANVDVTITDLLTGTANAATDYTYSTTVLTYTSLESYPNTKNVTISLNGDVSAETNETVILGAAVTSGTANLVSPTTHTLTINNDDSQVNISSIFPSASRNESTAGIAGSVIVNVQMDIAPTSNVVVALSDALTGTATTAVDYIPFDTTFTFTTGESYPATKTKLVTFIDDLDSESNETIIASLSVTSGPASVGINGTKTITILDNDAPGCPDLNGDVLFISEFHYDNTGTDVNEGVEVTGPAYLDLSNYKIYLYNGNGGILYDSLTLSGKIDLEFDNYGAIWFPFTSLQNGPDAIALYNSKLNKVVQLIKYGTGTPYNDPTNGVAVGLTAVSVGVSESNSDPINQSLKITGTGTCPGDLAWTGTSPHSRGIVNTGLTYVNKVDRYYSNANGNLSTAIWSSTPTGGTSSFVLPHANVYYIVRSGRTVAVDVDSLLISSIENNGNINLGTKRVFLTRDFIDNSNATLSAYNLEFIGGLNGNLKSSYTLGNIRINKTGAGTITCNNTVTADGPSIAGTLSLDAGTINTNDKVTINSDATATGAIGLVNPAFTINGKFTIERYLQAGVTNFRFLTMPISNGTILDWNDDVTTTGFPLSEFPDYPTPSNRFVSVQKYVEPTAGGQDIGLVGPADINEAAPDGRGFRVYIGETETPGVIDVTGNIVTGTKNYNLNYTVNVGDPGNAPGWNLIGNPYAATIDWTALTRTNVDNSFYIFNSSSNQYNSYINGVSTGLVTNLIASSQSFFVRANAASPSISFSEAAKSTNNNRAFIRSEEDGNALPILRLSIVGNGYTDETVLVLNPESTEGFDGNYDAFKFFSPNEEVPSISSVIFDDQEMDLSINALPEFEESYSIPIRVKAGVTGSYTLNNISENELMDNMCLVIEDLYTGTRTPFGNYDSYTFELSDSTNTPRFVMHMNKMVDLETADISCRGFNNGSATATGFGSETYNYIWKNSEGEIIKQTFDASSSDAIENLSEGYYTVEVSGLINECGSSYTKEFFIENPSVNSLQYSSSVNECNFGENGIINIYFEGPNNLYEVVLKNSDGLVLNNYSNVSTSMVIADLESGNYLIEATNTCETISSPVSLIDINAVDAKFEIPNEITAGESFAIGNTTTNATSYNWSMGDGNIYTIANPTHTYALPGSYTITLAANNTLCAMESEKQIEVLSSSVGVTEYNNLADAAVVINNQNIMVNFNKAFASEIRITDLTGKTAFSQKVSAEKNKTISINKNNFAKGVYVIQVMNNKQSIVTNKLFID